MPLPSKRGEIKRLFRQLALRPARMVRRVVRYLFNRPWGVKMGAGSYILRPYTLLYRDSLFVGAQTGIHSNAYITPLKKYGRFTYTPNITIGNRVYIGRYVYVVAIDAVTIEDGCVLAEQVYITDNSHGLYPERGPIMEQPLETKGPVRIGRECFIGYRASIMPGVVLGEHCIVGANSVVTRSFPPFSMVVGCPARLIKRYCHENRKWIPV